MKKTYATLLFGLLCFYSATFAQTKNDIELGVNIGLNQATVSNGQLFTDVTYRTGVNFGLSGEYYLSDRWSLKAKLIYDQKGWAESNDVIKANYITIPLMANWHFAKKRNWYLNFGPYVGFLMNATLKSDGSDIKSSFNSTDFGIALGIGVKIPVSENMKFFIELQGQGGLTDIAVGNPGASIVNSSSGLNVGVLFNLAK